MNCDIKLDDNNSETENVTSVIVDNEIHDLLKLDGIEVWGQNQNILEQQALTHLQILTETNNQNKKDVLKSEGEIRDDNAENNADININNNITKKKQFTGTLDLSKYLASQQELKNNFEKKKFNSVSEKSKVVAKKISQQQSFQKCHKKSSTVTHKHKKIRKDSENSNKSTVVKAEIENVNKNELLLGSIEREEKHESGSEYYPSDQFETDDEYKPSSSEKTGRKRKKSNSKEPNAKIKDDGLLANYEKRIKLSDHANDTQEIVIEDNLKILESKWNQLYCYQQDGIKWLWNIHKNTVGGLLGDEMGLGKTVQIILFLAALDYSKIKSYNKRYEGLGPSLIVCPATVIHQWVEHFHNWWPAFRVALLHQSGSYTGSKTQLINDINKNNGILVTTYESVLKYNGVLIEKKWHYIILDEGHKIRNPTAKITVAVKRFKTRHKLILTGSPMQNNLQELWSLFDFIVPGKLGSQTAFIDYFATPITQGGFVNATPTQETTALLIATSLKDMINPYMLRRTKEEVRDYIFLPNKSEQVLFCSLTDEQRDLYRGYLLSDQVGGILGRIKTPYNSENQVRSNILVGITTLRKICNHPDMYLGAIEDPLTKNPDEVVPVEKRFGYYKRSGKMIVVAALLKIWKQQGHRALLFTQARAMIEIFEDFLTQQGYSYLKMDGSTSVSSRQPIINKFNEDASYHVFLLTTKVGGLGVNLIGADRVIIYDPDWNPATDTQARERAWRIGQRREVTVYRLISAGTIEEKMYQRQVWKQLLSNKILIDPRTKRFFKTSDLNDLFSLQEHSEKNPETANIFRDSKVQMNKSSKPLSEVEHSITFSEEKIKAMKSLAQQIAKTLTKKADSTKEEIPKIEEPKIERPSPAEILAINRKKLEPKIEPIVNKIDDKETKSSFADALLVSENCNKHSKKLNKEKITDTPLKDEKEKITDTPLKDEQIEHKPKKEKKKVVVDNSGQIDGEMIEGLLKREVKKKEINYKRDCKTQDQYVLHKLFSKKGVQTALQHDVIVQSGYKDRNNLKIHYEAKLKADKALQALRKSRLNNWRY